jgi:hypothetical protein
MSIFSHIADRISDSLFARRAPAPPPAPQVQRPPDTLPTFTRYFGGGDRNALTAEEREAKREAEKDKFKLLDLSVERPFVPQQSGLGAFLPPDKSKEDGVKVHVGVMQNLPLPGGRKLSGPSVDINAGRTKDAEGNINQGLDAKVNTFSLEREVQNDDGSKTETKISGPSAGGRIGQITDDGEKKYGVEAGCQLGRAERKTTATDGSETSMEAGVGTVQGKLAGNREGVEVSAQTNTVEG